MSDEPTDPFTEKFFAWMDSAELKPKDIAPELNKQVQTIFNWRSKGVPKSQWVACEAVMERHHSAGKGGADEKTVFIVKPSYDQFQNWNRAALEVGKVMEEWAITGLDALADEAAVKALAVADKKDEYPSKKRKKKKKKKGD